MVTALWDVKAPTLEHYLGKGSTITSKDHSEMMTNKLKPEIHKLAYSIGEESFQLVT